MIVFAVPRSIAISCCKNEKNAIPLHIKFSIAKLLLLFLVTTSNKYFFSQYIALNIKIIFALLIKNNSNWLKGLKKTRIFLTNFQNFNPT